MAEIALPKAERTHDLVVFLAESLWGEEIRYALRSYEAYCPWLRDVWIVGYLPDYIDPSRVTHIPEERITPRGVFVESEARRIVNQLDGLSDEYIFGQDDCYLLGPVTPADLGPLWLEDLTEISNRGSKPWQQMLWRTHDLLVHMGYPAHNYEAHTPTLVDRSRYAEVAARFIRIEEVARHRYHGVCAVSAYWNMAEQPPARRLANQVRVGFIDEDKAASEEAIESLVAGKTFLYHDDAGLNPALKRYLSARFASPSRYEAAV